MDSPAVLKGRRVSLKEFWRSDDRQCGDYAGPVETNDDEAPSGEVWWVCDPAGNVGRLVTHTIEEHKDGTITARPSILIDKPHGLGWHGWLEHGIWRSV